MKKPSHTQVIIMNWSLYLAILLLIAGVGVGSYFLHKQLVGFATEVDHMKIDTDLSEQGIENAKKLRRMLAENHESVERAAAIVADTKFYEYQNQIVEDINSYAAASGLTILGFDFSTKATSKSSGISGVNTVVATVNLQTPVQYTNYLRFLKLIERNLTKMQVTQLDISNDLKVAGTISSPIVTLEVYVR